METMAGIKYTKDSNGNRRYVRVDLDLHGENQLLEDFLDGLDVTVQKGEETITLDEFNKYIDKRIEMNV